MTAEEKDTLTKELEASSEKNKVEMVRLRDGMAELLDERVRVCQTKFFRCSCSKTNIRWLR